MHCFCSMTLSRRAFHSVVGKAFGTALPLSVGRLQNLALSRVVPEQLLNQIDVGEQHATAAVAVESQLGQRSSVTTHILGQYARIPSSIISALFADLKTYPSSMPVPSGPPVSISLTYLVQRSPTTCFRERLWLACFLSSRWRLIGCALTLPQEKQRTGMIILAGRDGCMGEWLRKWSVG